MARRRAGLAACGFAVTALLALSLPAWADTLADGIAAWERGDIEVAEQLLLQASSESPLDPKPYEWLAKVYERDMDMERWKHALEQANRLHQRARQKEAAAAKAAAAAAAKPQHRTSIRLGAGDMPKRELAEIENTLAPLQEPLPPIATDAGDHEQKQVRLRQMEGTLSRLSSALRAVQQRLANYASTPATIKQKLDKLQGEVDKYTSAIKSLKQELGEE